MIEGGERDLEALGGFGLVPVGALEHVHNDAALDFLARIREERWARSFGELRAPISPGIGAANSLTRKRADTALHNLASADAFGQTGRASIDS